MCAMKTEGLDVIDRQTYPDGLVIEIHQQAMPNSPTLWSVVAYPRIGGVRTVGQFDSLRAAYDARDGYSGPR